MENPRERKARALSRHWLTAASAAAIAAASAGTLNFSSGHAWAQAVPANCTDTDNDGIIEENETLTCSVADPDAIGPIASGVNNLTVVIGETGTPTDVQGGTSNGIDLSGNGAQTINMLIEGSSIEGDDYGISVTNSDRVTINTTGGSVDGYVNGIFVDIPTTDDSEVVVTTAKVTSRFSAAVGVIGGNSVRIDTTAGAIYGEGDAVAALFSGDGILDIKTGDLHSDNGAGVMVFNYGAGATNIDTTGGIVRSGKVGTSSFLMDGVLVRNFSGSNAAANITVGEVQASSGDGVEVLHDAGANGNVNITLDKIVADEAGVLVDANDGDVTINLTADGSVESETDIGVSVVVETGDVTLAGAQSDVPTGAIQGATDGVNITTDGDVTVEDLASIIGEAGDGLNVDADGGAIRISSVGTILGVSGGGIHAVSDDGDVSIQGVGLVDGVKGTRHLPFEGHGIYVDAGSGAVNIGDELAIGDVTGGANSAGIFVDANEDVGGGITIDTSESTVSGGRFGVKVDTRGDRQIMITVDNVTGGTGVETEAVTGVTEITLTSTALVQGTTGAGIDAQSAGGALTVQGSSGAIIGSTDGVFLRSAGGDITVQNIDSITGKAGDGLDLASSGGDITISNIGTILGTGGNGIRVDSDGGAISIQGVGLVGGVTGRGNNDGIWADAGTGSIDIGGTTAIGNVTGGIDVKADGDITIDSSGGLVTAGRGTAIFASSATGAVSITVDDVYGFDNGIDVYLGRFNTNTAIIEGGTADATVSSNRSAAITGYSANGEIEIRNFHSVTSDNSNAISFTNYDSGSITISNIANVTGADGAIYTFVEDGDISIQNVGVGDGNLIEGKDGSGIYARTYNGAINIGGETAVGNITGSSFGIQAKSYFDKAIIIDSSAGTVTGGTGDGILATQFGTGNISITVDEVTGNRGVRTRAVTGETVITLSSTANVVGTSVAGVDAYSQRGSITVQGSSGAITGATDGVHLRNRGGGDITLQNIASITGQAGDGIDADATGSSFPNGDIFISNVMNITGHGDTTTGGFQGHGIRAVSIFADDISIQGVGLGDGNLIAGKDGDGIFVETATANVSIGGDVAVGNVEGSNHGIYVTSYRGPSVTIDSSGGTVAGANDGIRIYSYDGTSADITTAHVTGGAGDGIYVRGISVGGILTIDASAGAVSGGDRGIEADYFIRGAVMLTVDDVTGFGAEGIRVATDFTSDASITIQGSPDGAASTADIIGATTGIVASTEGAEITVQDIASVTGQGGDGLDLASSGGAITVSNIGTILGTDGNGILADSDGGAISIQGVGQVDGVTGTNGNGISAESGIGGIDIGGINRVGSVSGSVHGIFTKADAGPVTIAVGGDVRGGTGAGIFNDSANGAFLSVFLDSTSSIAAASGNAITDTAGDSSIIIANGARVSGAVQLGNGSDSVVFGADLENVTVLDGGDDSGTADGMIDTLTFNGASGVIDGDKLINWEIVELANGDFSVNDNTLTAGDTTSDTGLFMTNARLNAGAVFNLDGSMTIDANAIFDGDGGGAGIFGISGNLTSFGAINMQDGAAGDVFSVAGDFSGAGTLNIDTDFALDSADTLTIGGSVSGGPTMIFVADVSTGFSTGNDVTLVEVAGTSSADAFVLAGGLVNSGIYSYQLAQSGSDWILVSDFNNAVSAYEALPAAMTEISQSTSWRSRIGGRNYVQGEGSGEAAYNTGVWMRMMAHRSNISAGAFTNVEQFTARHYGVQVGSDMPLFETADGVMLGGVNYTHRIAAVDIENRLAATSKIDINANAAAVSMTWIGHYGLHVDGQFQATLFEAKVDDNKVDGTGYSASVEVGHRVDLAKGWWFTPETQAVWSSVGFGTFSDDLRNTVSIDDGKTWRLRLGVAAGRDWTHQDGHKGTVYGVFNLNYVADGATQVNVSDNLFSANNNGWMADIGIGGKINWRDGRAQLVGEVSRGTNLGGDVRFDDTEATIGMRWEF